MIDREDVRRQLTENGADPDAGSLENLDFDFGFADSAQSTAERNKVLAVIQGLKDRLSDVEAALAKMDSGGYGTCERCGETIPLERLEAIPYARLCVKDKQKESH
jgi:RNA polymerase-binding transcription factor DksA